MRIVDRAVHGEVLQLIDQAQRSLVLISPYFQPWDSLIRALERATLRGVAIVVIARGGPDKARQEQGVAQLRGRLAMVGYVERLHAKVYLSEHEALVTSMNLLGTSALDSEEIAVYLRQRDEPDPFGKVKVFCDRMIAQAEQDRLRSRVNPAAEEGRATKPDREPRRPRRARGSCIRCAEAVPLNLDKPLCGDCYSSWAQYENYEYPEKYCHACGDANKTTMAKPLCRPCFQQAS